MGASSSSNSTSKKTSSNVTGVTIKSYTWKKDSHGLFDYENQFNMNQDQITINATTSLVRVQEEVRIEQQQSTEDKHNQDSLFAIRQRGNQFQFVQDAMLNEGSVDGLLKNSAWIAVRSLQDLSSNKNENNSQKQGFELKVNDYIKLGRVRFRVKELSAKVSAESSSSTGIAAQEASEEQEIVGQNKETCRICWTDTYTKRNKFISPCSCTGSVAHVHEECLSRWLKSKIQYKETPVHSYYSIKNLECELCKYKFTEENMFKNGKDFESLLIQKPTNCPYMVLELLSKEKKVVRAIQLIKYEQLNQVVIGRGSDSDIKITDISVSREHATIKLENNKFILQDNNSKFGTLVLLQRPIDFTQDCDKIELQIGRSLCTFQLQRQSSVFAAFCSGKGKKKQNTHSNSVYRIDLQQQHPIGQSISPRLIDKEDLMVAERQSSPLRIRNQILRNANNANLNQDMDSPIRIQPRGGALGTRHNLPDTMQHIFGTSNNIQNPQTSDDLNLRDESPPVNQQIVSQSQQEQQAIA